jgi:hypothetical protein
MTLLVRRKTSPGSTKIPISLIIAHLMDKGYNPLIAKAKQQFLNTFDESIQIKDVVDSIEKEYSSKSQSSIRRRVIYGRSYTEETMQPIAGEIFFSSDGNGLLYVLLSEFSQRRLMESESGQIEVGYIGDEEKVVCLDHFIDLISEVLSSQSQALEWSQYKPPNPPFLELSGNKETEFVSADTISDEEIQLAVKLDDQTTREIAVIVRRSGGILEADLSRKDVAKPIEIKKNIEKLVQAQLLGREYVVICRKTSNQINRVKSTDAIKKMTEAGVLCSCGTPISEERIEELITPTNLLQKMLDQSYWTTVRLVDTLRNLGISNDQILLNLHEGAEEIDAFVDVDGTLCMFELKDNEFSMGHAYPFGGRIGLYKPDYAIIVSTKDISSDVKDYFKRVKPKSEIVYISKLKHLSSSMSQVISQVRSKKALQIIDSFGWMATTEIPFSYIAQKIGIQARGVIQVIQ